MKCIISSSFVCVCQKANMVPSQSTLNVNGICEHVLLILAAIMSDSNLQKEFESLVNIIKTFISNTIDECQWVSDVSMDLNCLNDSFRS